MHTMQQQSAIEMKVHTYIAVLLSLSILYTEQLQPLIDYPMRIPGKILEGVAATSCPSDQDIADVEAEFRQNITSAILMSPEATYDCGETSGWRRAGHLDMTNASESCPSGLTLRTYSRLRTCGPGTVRAGACWSMFYPVTSLY